MYVLALETALQPVTHLCGGASQAPETLDAKYWADFMKDAVAAIAGAGIGAWLSARAGIQGTDGMTPGMFIAETYTTWVNASRPRTAANTLEKLHRLFGPGT